MKETNLSSKETNIIKKAKNLVNSRNEPYINKEVICIWQINGTSFLHAVNN